MNFTTPVYERQTYSTRLPSTERNTQTHTEHANKHVPLLMHVRQNKVNGFRYITEHKFTNLDAYFM